MAPIRRLTKKEVNLLKKPWITNGILVSIRDRNEIHRQFLKEKDQDRKTELFQSYKLKRNLIKTLIRESKRGYYVHYFEENKSNSKKTWEGIRKIVNTSKANNVSPVQINYNNEIKTDKKEMAQSFNDFLVGIGSMVENKIPKGKQKYTDFLGESNSNTIFLTPVDNDEVEAMLAKLKTSKSCGPNSIPTNLLKLHCASFIEPIKEILNMSLFQGTFPTLLKDAEVCPIFKKKDKEKCENYRPISLLSNLSKLFERAMHSRLYDFIERKKQINFMKNNLVFGKNIPLITLS